MLVCRDKNAYFSCNFSCPIECFHATRKLHNTSDHICKLEGHHCCNNKQKSQGDDDTSFRPTACSGDITIIHYTVISGRHQLKVPWFSSPPRPDPAEYYSKPWYST